MTEAKAQILFVDDEPPILNSLKRLFRPSGYRVHIANSGAEALTVLRENPIDVVVSDMRMPEMDGAQFLTNVSEEWPETTRMLLTGYADLTSAIDAINNGSITRYLTKPWQDADLVMCLEQAIETRRLTHEKNRLETLTREQNSELMSLNEGLEEKVAQRTREIDAARESLLAAHNELRSSYRATVEIFSRLIQSRAGMECRSSVAHDASAVGQSMGLNEDECQALYKAGLLCDVGKLSLPDASVTTPYTRLDADSQREYQRHPIIAEATLVSLEPLAAAASIIRMHCERTDGSGFPDKIAGDAIPLSARILAVCKSFVDLQSGSIFTERMTVAEARAFLEEQKNKRYDAEVVDHFITWLDDQRRQNHEVSEKRISLIALRAGMRTTRDFCDSNGVLVLAKGQEITNALIDRLVNLQGALDDSLVIYVEE